ncbi:MAG: hypothetical protein H8E64_01865 [Candidatus Marinimicrobia bacterium]|nr:hypothetical protein [Candidatus Neomarinimicrobiota bacterium]
MIELVLDKTAGVNGGFEVNTSRLPMNWLVYSPNTVEEGEFTISADETIFVDGKQSLHRIQYSGCRYISSR